MLNIIKNQLYPKQQKDRDTAYKFIAFQMLYSSHYLPPLLKYLFQMYPYLLKIPFCHLVSLAQIFPGHNKMVF